MKKALIFLLTVMLLSSILPVAWAEDPLIRLFGEGEADVLGKPFPDFTVKDTKKNEFTLSEALKDHEAVYITFFASWCGSCIEELPLLNEVYKQYGDRVAFLGLDFEPDDTMLDVAEIRIGNKVPFPMGKSDGTGINEYLGIFRLPQNVVIDRFGNLCFLHNNAFESADEVGRVLDCFLGDDYTESRVLTTVPMETSTQAFPLSGALTYHVDNESARKIAFRLQDSTDYAYIVNDDVAHLRFEVGPEVTPAEMVYDIDADSGLIRYALPSLLDPDRNAYVCDVPMDLTSDGNHFIYSHLNSRITMKYDGLSIFLFQSEEDVEEYLKLFREYEPDICWEYVDDEEPAVPQPETYILHLIDQYGDPVPDVKVNFCTDAACTLQIADGNGLVSFSAPVENYHVQLLKVPEGYSFDPDFEFYTGDAFGEWDILVRKD